MYSSKSTECDTDRWQSIVGVELGANGVKSFL